jgi:hypothetical protein
MNLTASSRRTATTVAAMLLTIALLDATGRADATFRAVG